MAAKRSLMARAGGFFLSLPLVASGSERLVVGADALHALEVLGSVNKSPLVVGAGVDKVGVVQRQLGGTVDNVVGGLDTEHERVVLVADLERKELVGYIHWGQLQGLGDNIVPRTSSYRSGHATRCPFLAAWGEAP